VSTLRDIVTRARNRSCLTLHLRYSARQEVIGSKGTAKMALVYTTLTIRASEAVESGRTSIDCPGHEYELLTTMWAWTESQRQLNQFTSLQFVPSLHESEGLGARLLLSSESRTSQYRSYATRYAAVILMKTSPKDASPWTRLTGSGGVIDSLGRFGQRCFVHVPKEV
jgi:hypothetical protein